MIIALFPNDNRGRAPVAAWRKLSDLRGMIAAIDPLPVPEVFVPFAEELIGVATVRDLAAALRVVAPRSKPAAVVAAETAIAPLSLRERSDLLRDALLEDLPGDYASFAAVIRSAAERAPTFTGWLIWPVTSAVAVKAIEQGGTEAFDDALSLLADLTHRLTSEFALRTLLDHDLGRALATITGWTGSDSPDVRRLASEGTRPMLPWAARVPGILAEPKATLPILNALYRDGSEYVRRSVANHLNDISRREPELAVATAADWLAEPGEDSAAIGKTVRHALRTLVKQGHPGALGLLGFAPARVDVTGPLLSADEVEIGAALTFAATVRNLAAEPVCLAIDYIVHHRKANGTTAGKTFKLATRVLGPGESCDLNREHSFRVITTRRYHPGAHALELQINGVRFGRAGFELLAAR
ncbi:DNA alkylation repair protein [Amycolatopsis sp. A133]|uniref:DNA alkylation repair protein n=1 Tax=Amycolatopsis sp. A133 TaxID=3064472 RepID=UPI0027EB968A|nr:DNA alkylation repair protein [Amycolatopsis sp. A133]MDQ7807569.1 DNA alkylation repair protein [Amycolatopsis sp. A133]